MQCIAENSLATEIVKSWGRPRSNHILIAPPMSRPRSVFRKLHDQAFIESCLPGISRTLSVAGLDTSDFKSEAAFVDGVLRGWNLSGSMTTQQLDPIEKLEAAVKVLHDKNRKPVILIQRFHEALDKLGEDIGTALRNLEHDFGLKTVVELPISLNVLRERWDLAKSARSPFLASNWGQGHTTKFLRGFSKDEVVALSSANGWTDRGVGEFLFDATSGLPELVESLISECLGKPPLAIKSIAQNRAPRLCERLLKWVDKPEELLFHRLLVAGISSASNLEIDHISLKDHDWREIFASGKDSFRPLMLAWAARESLAMKREKNFIGAVLHQFKYDSLNDVSRLLSDFSPGESSQTQLWAHFLLILEFCKVSDPFDPKWLQIQKILVSLQMLSDSGSGMVVRRLLDWSDLVGLMLRYESACSSAHEDFRIEQFVCAQNDDKAFIDFLRLLNMRLDRAFKLSGYLSMKAIVELPEAVLQLYAFKKYGVKFWSYDGTLSQYCIAISQRTKRPFQEPTKNSPLSFYHLLHFCYQIGLNGTSQDALLSSQQEVENAEQNYKLRKDQVHGTAFVSENDIAGYHEWCAKWLSELFKIVGCVPETIVSPFDLGKDLLAELSAGARSSSST